MCIRDSPSTTPVIGRHAFYSCPLLAKLSIYYGEHTLGSIGEDAFWRETDNGDTLYVAYIIGYPDSSVPSVTYGPGLVGALLVGVAEAKAISYAKNIPLVGVHHLSLIHI